VNEPLLLPVREAARRLGIGRDRCYELVRRGELRAVAVGRRRLIPRSELEVWIARQLEGAEAEVVRRD
jgi:excisionase family DNA binding protein